MKPKEQSEKPEAARPLRVRAYDDLKAALLRGQFSRDRLLSERKLAAELGMSKTPVRAALERLEAEGFVSISPRQGILVRDVSVQEVADKYEFRVGIEPFVLKKLAGKLSPVQVARLEANLDAQGETLKSDDLVRFSRLDADFHLLFCEFLGNQEIQRVIERLQETICRVTVEIAKKDSAIPIQTYREHRRIAAALVAGDGEEAARLVVAHLEAWKLRLLLPNQLPIRPPTSSSA